MGFPQQVHIVKAMAISEAMSKDIPLSSLDTPQLGHHAKVFTLTYVVWNSNISNAIIDIMHVAAKNFSTTEYSVEFIYIDEECSVIKLVFPKEVR